jgi:hypothetical protein
MPAGCCLLAARAVMRSALVMMVAVSSVYFYFLAYRRKKIVYPVEFLKALPIISGIGLSMATNVQGG